MDHYTALNDSNKNLQPSVVDNDFESLTHLLFREGGRLDTLTLKAMGSSMMYRST